MGPSDAGAIDRPDSSTADLDRDIAILRRTRHAWIEAPLARKVEYARIVLRRTVGVARRQVAAAARAKGIPVDSSMVAEEWLAGPYAQVRVLRTLIESLERIRDHGTLPIDPRRVRTRPDGRVTVEVLPLGPIDRVLYQGFRADVWMQPEVTAGNLSRHTGGVHTKPGARARVALVLGGGNVASIAPCDVVHKLFVEGQVVLLKLHPVNRYLGPFLEEAFADLIRDGFLRTAYGGAEVGEYLCRHEGIDEIHITGCQATHDAIVFGGGEGGARRKARGERLLAKRITSELGNVSPVILVPGDWTERDLRFHAESVATQMVHNGGFNCNATKVIVTHDGWSGRAVFLDRLRDVLRAAAPHRAYYPGAIERYERFLEAYPGAEALGERTADVLPPTLVTDLDPARRDALGFTVESFCPITVETALPGADAREFLANAVAFCNEALIGTLSAGIIVDPAAADGLGDALDSAVAGLRYGSIAINHWAALSFILGTTTWGAFPGHTPADIQSGTGVVHNTMLFDRPERSVVYGPFRTWPRPPWFVTHRNAHRVAPRLVALEGRPSLFRLPGVVLSAARG